MQSIYAMHQNGSDNLEKQEKFLLYSTDNILDLYLLMLSSLIEIAKKEGKFKGRVRKYHDNHAGMNYAVKLYHEGNMTVKEICQITNISRASLYRKLTTIQ